MEVTVGCISDCVSRNSVVDRFFWHLARVITMATLSRNYEL